MRYESEQLSSIYRCSTVKSALDPNDPVKLWLKSMQKRRKSGVFVYLRMEVRTAGKDPQCPVFVTDNMLTAITVIGVLLPQNLKLEFIEEAVLWSGKKRERKASGRHGDPLQSSITEHC